MAGRKGERRPEDVRERISKTLTGKKKSAEHAAKIKQANAKYPMPLEYYIDYFEKKKKTPIIIIG